ncbi:MAG: hypothetical protein QOG07_2581 [Pseudonocardiales bacterium]|nr:hypothetical protein [Pseudonocardiales bacterium]
MTPGWVRQSYGSLSADSTDGLSTGARRPVASVLLTDSGTASVKLIAATNRNLRGVRLLWELRWTGKNTSGSSNTPGVRPATVVQGGDYHGRYDSDDHGVARETSHIHPYAAGATTLLLTITMPRYITIHLGDCGPPSPARYRRIDAGTGSVWSNSVGHPDRPDAFTTAEARHDPAVVLGVLR